MPNGRLPGTVIAAIGLSSWTVVSAEPGHREAGDGTPQQFRKPPLGWPKYLPPTPSTDWIEFAMSSRHVFDLARLRRETPGVENRIHFNNAGAALPPQPVVDAMIGHLRREAAIGGYEAEDEAEARIAAIRGSIARLLNADPAEIALVENATVGWWMAFHALPLGPGERILTARAEYASNYISYLQAAKRRGVLVETVPSRDSGELDLEALDRMIDGRVRLISITHVPNNGGLVNPAAEVGRIARRHGIPYLLDACQSAGQLPLDVAELGCDMLSATGRKYLRGPRGTGFLYVRQF
jgi:cysteine desulfurase / selenocysteine lyase